MRSDRALALAAHDLERRLLGPVDEVVHVLQAELDQALNAGEDSEGTRKRLSSAVVEFFEHALKDVIHNVGARVGEVLRVHQRRLTN